MNESKTAFLSELSIWERPLVQKSIEDYVQMQVRPVAAYSKDGPIKFYIPNAIDEYVLLNESELYIKIKLTAKDQDGKSPAAASWAQVAPTDNFFHSLFQKVKLSINNTVVSDDSENYAFKAYFESLLGWSATGKKSDLSTVIFDSDSAKRAAWLKPFVSSKGEYAEFYIGGMLHFDLAFQPKAILGGSDLSIELVPNNKKFMFTLGGDAIVDVDYEFTDIVYFVHKTKVSKEIEVAHRQALSIAPARYPFTKTSVHTALVTKGLNACTLDNVFLGDLPRRMFIGILPESTLNGDYKADTMKFINAKVTRLAVLVNGRQFPHTAYEPNFTCKQDSTSTESANCVREFRGFLQALGENHSGGRLDISLQDWWNNPIYAFNFCPDLSSGAGDHICPSKSGQINIKVNFEKPTDSALIFVIYAEFDRMLHIDKVGGVHLE